MGEANYKIVFGRVMSGRHVDEGGFRNFVDEITRMSKFGRRLLGLGTFSAPVGYGDGFYVGQILVDLREATWQSSFFSVACEVLVPSPNQREFVASCVSKLPDEIRSSPKLMPTGVHVLRLGDGD